MARGRWTAVLPILFAMLYGVSPIDLIPDVLPLVGLVDDGVVGILMGFLSIWLLLRRRRAHALRRTSVR